MQAKDILKLVDHTLLNPCATWADINRLCQEAIQYQTACVCIPPAFVAQAAAAHRGLVLCTVLGFPLGYASSKSKLQEGENALSDGASEIDMVVNLGDVKNGEFGKVTQEITAMKKLAGANIVKVIVETCYLSQEEKIALCGCVSASGANYIKTSTGFGSAGANLADIALFKQHLAKGVKIKASGGIRTKQNFEDFAAAGVQRIGSSAAVQVYSQISG